jgi:hypothetical protein
MPKPFVLPQGFTQIPPNYGYVKVGERGFPLKAEKAVLQALVKRCLNDHLTRTGYSYTLPTLGKYSPVYLIVSTYGSMASLKPPFSTWGRLSQTEVIFTIPLLRLKNGIPDGIALYTPFCFVDNAWSIVTGNMILGFQKGLASFQLQPTLSQPYPIEIKTAVFPLFNGGPLSEKVWIRIDKTQPFELARDPKVLWPLGSIKDLYQQGDFQVEGRVLELLNETVTTGLVQVVQLLQLRDPDQPDFAAYSRIVKFGVRLKHVSGGGLLDSAEVELTAFASLPVLATLGLVPEGGKLIPVFPFWIESNFDFELQP